MYHTNYLMMNRYLPWILLNIPSSAIFIGLLISPSLHKTFIHYTGWLTISLLIFLLLLNPYIKIMPLKFPLITKFARFCNRFRQELGVSVFIYACVHFFCFFIKRGSLRETLYFFLHPALIPGWISLLIFLALAITSHKYFIKKLGFPRWKKLHKKVYIAEWLIMVHLFLTKHIFLILAFVPLIVFQKLRRKERNIS